MRVTAIGISYNTAHILLSNPVVVQSQSSSTLAVVVIIVIIFIVIVAIIAILVAVFMIYYRRKHKPKNATKRAKPSVPAREAYPGYENLSKLTCPSKQYIDLPTNPNPEYMTIDETSMIPVEPEDEHKIGGYANLTNAPTYSAPYEQISEIGMQANAEMNPAIPYERYVPMTSVKQESTFHSKYVPIKEFPTTYQLYVASASEKNSLFSVEFKQLSEESKVNVDALTKEARNTLNTSKNPVKYVPFDENRVVLDSPHFDCNYINASWFNDYNYIATIHPTKETHRDFLQMIYQTEASMVIMLTTRREKAKIIGGLSNRVCYWPKKDEPINCEPFIASLVNSTETTAFIKQEISLKNASEGKEHTFTQCISPIWNEDTTVGDLSHAVNLLSRIMKHLQDDPDKSIIIHCEDGVSKTGIILTAISSVRELTKKRTINIFNSVRNLRRQRMEMVPTLACYTTCYSLMNEYCSIHL